jgi:hypothetical protein
VVTATTHKRWVAVKAVRRARSRPSPTSGSGRWVPVKARRRVLERAVFERVAFEPEPEAPPREVPRVEIVEDVPAPAPTRVLPARSRAIRITRVKTNGRRRWSVDFLVRGQDDRR